MSKYTTTLRNICETLAGFSEGQGFDNTINVINTAAPKLFNFPFPIWDENYKSVLEHKIISHYYFNEIGEETVGLWKMRLYSRLNEIMPYYNQLYNSTIIEFNPLIDTDYTVEHGGSSTNDETRNASENSENNRTSADTESGDNSRRFDDNKQSQRTDNLTGTMQHGLTQTTQTTVEKKDAYSDTPQQGLSGVDNLTYLTNYRKINDNNSGSTQNSGSDTQTNTGTQTINNTGYDQTTENYTKEKSATETNTATKTNNDTLNASSTDEYLNRIYGKQSGKTYMEMIKQLRDNIINIDLQIINELSDLFMQIW